MILLAAPGLRAQPPTPTPTPIPTVTPTPIPFTSLDFRDGGVDVAYQGVMFWVVYWETISDSATSGSSVDTDLTVRYADFLFQPTYCVTGANPPSDNAAESIIFTDPTNPNDPYWV